MNLAKQDRIPSRSFPKVVALRGVLLLTAASLATAADEPAANRPLVVAHRGFSCIAPENTVVAAKEAINIGVDGTEFDVHSSSDGALIVIHDGTVDRTTNGRGKVAGMTLAELKKLDAGSWKDPRFVKERLPVLQEMLDATKNAACKPVIEIKGENTAEKVVAAVQAAQMVDHAYIISFNADNVKIVRALEPAIPAALLLEMKQMPKDLTADQQVAWLIQAAADCKTSFLDLNYQILTKEIVDKLHEKKLTVWVWTVDEPKTMDNMIAWGIDGITTNCPDLLQERIKAAGK
jgi:glycerophosphoryl diester phosphodiesterase